MTSLLIQHLITTTLLASLVWIVCRLAKPAPAARHILWSLVMLKLIIPPMGEVNVTVPMLPSIEETRPAAVTPRIDSGVTARQEPLPPIDLASTSNWKEPILAASTPSTVSTSSAPMSLPKSEPTSATPVAPMNWQAMFIAAWLCGAFLMAVLQLIRWQRFTAQTSASGETPAWLRDEVATVAKRLNCKAVPVTVCNRLSTPAVAGVLRPRILVPLALLERVPRERWRALLAHELAHVKRHDTWWRALELACGIVWFWNPVFWIARKQARTAAEHACDAWVVWALPEERRAYADSLVDVSEWASSPNLPATAIGMSAASRTKLEVRLNAIVSGHALHRASKRAIAMSMILLLAALPGWALEAKNAAKPESESLDATLSKPEQVVLAQAERPKAGTVPKPSTIERALGEPLSIEFDDEYVGTILDFISGYIGINIVLDYGVVEAKRPSSSAEMEVVHVGPHWYKHARREHLGTREWPKSQVVDGMVGPFDDKVSSVTDVLDKLLPDAGMTYAITPDCIWITVAKPQFEIKDPRHEPGNWVWYPDDRAPFGARETKVGRNILALHDSTLQSTQRVRFQTDKIHIAEVAPRIHKMFASRPAPGGTIRFGIPPIIVDAAAIAAPRSGDIPKSYLIASDKSRNESLFTGGREDAFYTSGEVTRRITPSEAILLRSGVKPSKPVTSGIVPFIRLDDVPLDGALTALLRPLNLTYVAQPEFIYITSPERAQHLNFDDRPVPPDQDELRETLDEPTTIEFHDEYIGTILEFLSGYLGINIVLDSRSVITEDVNDFQDIGTKPVTTGHVPFIKVDDLRLADTLKALLTPLGLDYSIGPGFIWVSSPEFIDEDKLNLRAQSAHMPVTLGLSSSAPPRALVPQPRVPLEPAMAEIVTLPTTVVPPERRVPIVDGKKFRRITRWENGDPRIEIELNDGHLKWFQIGAMFEDMEIADIDVIANQVIIVHRGELRVLQLSWPVQEGVTPTPRPKGARGTTSRWTWTPIPYGNVKFGPIARWENSDPRLQVEFPNGQRKWLEVGDAIGNARIGGINIIANQVIVRTPEGQTRTFDLPRPIQVPSATAPRAKRSPKQPKQRTWTPVAYGSITIGRIARWEDSDARVEIELVGGERKWLEIGQSIGGVKIVNIDIVANRILVERNGSTEVVQLPWSEKISATRKDEPDPQPFWIPIPNFGAKFGGLARWEDSDPLVHVEFPNGERKWLEVGDKIGEATIDGINIITYQVDVSLGNGEKREFVLPRPELASKRPGVPWKLIDYDDARFWRIARWESDDPRRLENSAPRLEVEFGNGEREWLEDGDSFGNRTVKHIDIRDNSFWLGKDGASVVIQLPWGEDETAGTRWYVVVEN